MDGTATVSVKRVRWGSFRTKTYFATAARAYKYVFWMKCIIQEMNWTIECNQETPYKITVERDTFGAVNYKVQYV